MNNAGTLRWGPVEWEPLASFKAVADVNLWGLIDVTKTFLPLVKQERGRIVNMSSLSGEQLSHSKTVRLETEVCPCPIRLHV